jgi:3-hydroxyisobutyrate dehydrogenase
VLASGPDEARERCKPVFDAVGQKTLWLGAAGVGSRLKLVVNAWILGLVGTLAETIALSEATDVDPESFFEAIGGGPLDLPYAQVKGRMMVSHDYPTSFSAKLAAKDADLVLEAAGKVGLEPGIIRAVTALFDRALESGHGDEDMAAIHDSAHRDGR